MLMAWLLFSIPLLVLGIGVTNNLGGSKEIDGADLWGGLIFFLCPFWAIYFLIR